MSNGGAPIKTFNQSFSCLAPMVLPVDLDFTLEEKYLLDLSDFLSQGYMDYVSSVYVNMRSVTGFDLVLRSNDIPNQEIFCKRGTINYMPIFLSNWPKIQCEISAPLNGILQICVSNIPFFPFVMNAT